MSLFAELKRRNVIKVAGAYLALAWVVVQATGAIVPALNLPASLVPTVVWIGVIGFPCVLIFSWAYELTPEGLKRESEVDRSQSITHVTSKRLDYIIIGLMVVAIGLFVLQYLRPPVASTAVEAAATVATPEAGPTAITPPATEPAPAAVPAPSEKSIAVLPFVNMSSDIEQEYFSDGISEELLNLLAKIPELQVIARTSSFSYKGKDVKVEQIGQELRVAHVLEGSVRKAGNTVRITAQLVRTVDSTHLWSETWDRPLDNIFAVQDEIAGAVVEQMKVKLLDAAPKSRVTDPRAYSLFLRARPLAESGTAESLQEAIALYEQGLAIDSGYPEAWRKLAAIASVQAGFGLISRDEANRRMRDYIGKALAIDPEFGRAYDGLASMALDYDLDVAAAARHATKALALDPRNADILFNSQWIMAALGRMDQAIAMSEYVLRQDPLAPMNHAGIAFLYVLAGRADEAIPAAHRALELNPAYLRVRVDLALALLLKGDAQAALVAAEQEPLERARLAALPVLYQALGRRAESDAALASLVDKYGESSAFSIAAVHAYRGESDQAFAALDAAFATHDSGVTTLASDPLFAGLREDPRWLPLLRAHGLAPEQLVAIKFDVKLPQ